MAQVEVVTPLKVKQYDIDKFVNANLDWIERHKRKILDNIEQDENLSNIPPEKIHFPLISKTYQVKYFSVVKKPKFSIKDNVISIYSDCDEEKRKYLKKVIHNIAKVELTRLLEEISHSNQMPYNRVFIKAQKSRWGSCSSKKNINLNRNLIFLNLTQVEYLIVHELCHTVHMNHSSLYWQLVSEFIPDYKTIDKSLRNATINIPLWALS